MRNVRKGISLWLAAILLLTNLLSVPIAALEANELPAAKTEQEENQKENSKGQEQAPEKEKEEKEKEKEETEEVKLTALGFAITLLELKDLTREGFLEKAVAKTTDNSEITLNEEEFESLKAATKAGDYKVTLQAGEEKAEVTVEVKQNRPASREVATDNGVTIDIPDYVAANKWRILQAYDVKVIANFGDVTSVNKKLTIKLPDGMKFVNYPVNTTPTGIQTPATGVLNDFMVSYTTPATTDWDTLSGEITYEFVPGASSVEIPLKVAVDERVYYDTLGTITAGVQAKATKGTSNTSVGQAKMNIHTAGDYNPTYGTTSSESNRGQKVLSGEEITLPAMLAYPSSGLYSYPHYEKAREYVYYYPIGFTYVTSSHDADKTEVRDDLGYVKFKFGASLATQYQVPRVDITLSSGSLTPGTYEAISGPYVNLTQNDGTVVQSTVGTKAEITVADSYPNKANLTIVHPGTYFDFGADYETFGPLPRITNGRESEKTDQWVEVEVPSDYLASQIFVPFDSSVNPGGARIWYERSDNLGTMTEATTSEILYSDTTNAYSTGITTASLGLPVGVTITKVKASIGTIAKAFESTPTSASRRALQYVPRVAGKLKPGVTTATVTVHSYAEVSGVEEAGTRTTKTSPITRVNANEKPTTSAYREIPGTTISAGQTKKVGLFLRNPYHYGQVTALINPEIYLRVPEGVTYSNPTVTSTTGTASATMSAPYTTTTGERFVKITTANTKVGGLFNGEADLRATISFDITVSPQAKGANYSWTDYVFIKEEKCDYVQHLDHPNPTADIYDVDNDGDLTEKVMPLMHRQFNIIPNENLIIDTYITPQGETRKPAYDGTDTTAIGFTPEAHADYNVEIYNNCAVAAKNIVAYVPVPKTGNNFGTEFQPEAFKWDMKLGTAPVLSVEDEKGDPITDPGILANYKIYYATDATTNANYQGATYSTTFDANATMIKVVNTTGMARGEKATLKCDYIVDETDTSLAANPEKLNSVNDFRPFYSFQAGGNIGSLSGTKAGAKLTIGRIAGIAFKDTNYNGTYEVGVDTALPGKTVTLLKHDGTAYVAYGTPKTTAADGSYEFTSLPNGDYQVDFNGVIGLGQKFVIKDKGTDDTIDSDVEHTGTNLGKALAVDPTSAGSKYLYAGVIDYEAPTIDITKDTTSIKQVNVQQPNITELLAYTYTPSYLMLIKSGDVTWTSSDSAKLTVDSDGYIRGITPGVYTVTAAITDVYGGYASDTIEVTVLTNEIPTITGNNITIELGDLLDEAEAKALVTVADLEDDLSNTPLTLDITSNAVPLELDSTAKETGVFEVAFKVTDSDGNIATKTLTVTVQDTRAPLVAVGNNPLYYGKGTTNADEKIIADAGLTITDAQATTSSITDRGGLDFDTVGSYPIVITVKDLSNNSTTVNVTVEVVELITAHNFTHTLAGLDKADLVSLAGALGWDVSDPTQAQQPISVSLASERPTTVGLHDFTFKNANGQTVTVKGLITNEAPVGNEAVVAHDFTVALEDVPKADFVALAKAKGYDISDMLNGFKEIPVSFVGTKPTTEGQHPARFETAGGAFAEVIATVTQEKETLQYFVDGNDIEMSVSELNDAVANNKLEEIVLKRSEAKAWSEGVTDGKKDLVAKADTTALAKVKAPTEEKVELFTESEEVTKRDVNGQKLATKDINVKVTADNNKDNTEGNTKNPSENVATGDKTNPLLIAILLVISSVVVFIALKKKSKRYFN